jgi:hypothetical protein
MLPGMPPPRRPGLAMPDGPRRWTVVLTPEAQRWMHGLDARDRRRMAVALDDLERGGPALGRPRVDAVRGSRHRNMKELRSVGGHLRALFAFDQRRRAIVLVGGDKTNDWSGWYRRNIARADALYDRHQRAQGKEGAWRTQTRAGGRSGGSSR